MILTNNRSEWETRECCGRRCAAHQVGSLNGETNIDRLMMLVILQHRAKRASTSDADRGDGARLYI